MTRPEPEPWRAQPLVTDLCDAYRAQGYVMGDLAHDGTLRAQALATEDRQHSLRCMETPCQACSEER